LQIEGIDLTAKVINQVSTTLPSVLLEKLVQLLFVGSYGLLHALHGCASRLFCQ
jgi:hypothetical protein